MLSREKLKFAIGINSSRIQGQRTQQADILVRELSRTVTNPNQITVAEWQLGFLSKYAGEEANQPLRDKVAAGKALAAFLEKYDADPTAPLVHEFCTTVDQGEYEGGNDSGQPIDVRKLRGATGELLHALSCGEIEVEWLKITHPSEASFRLKIS